jgi:hypothetical protein
VSDNSRAEIRDSAVERAETIVAELEGRLAEYLSMLLARGVEEAQDIWAEAQALRRQRSE